MKQLLRIAVALLLASVLNSFGAPLANASCYLDQGNRQFSRVYTLTDSGSAQCKPPAAKPNGTYTVWCDTATEANAADSVRQPLCGSSPELGKANSTCWLCGSVPRCAGAAFALGVSDQFLFSNRQPVNPGDATDQIWRVPGSAIPASGFNYNGHRYAKPSGDLIMCNANVVGCGASDASCTNMIYGDITGPGPSSGPGFPIQTEPGVTAVTLDAPKSETVMSPTTPLVTLLNKFVTMVALFGQEGKQVIEFPDLDKQATLMRTIPELYPEKLQPKISLPENNPQENELNAQIGGRACSAKSTADTDKALGGVLVSEIYRPNFYQTLDAGALLSGPFGAIHTYDPSGKLVGNGLYSLNLKTPPKKYYQGSGNNFVITDEDILQGCNTNSTGSDVEQLDLPVKGGTIATANKPPLNVQIPQERYDPPVKNAIQALLDFLSAGSKCLSNIAVCRDILQSLGTGTTLTVICPGCEAQDALANGGNIATVDQQQNEWRYKGWVNTMKPSGVSFIEEPNGNTNQAVNVSVRSSPEENTGASVKLPWSKIRSTMDGIDKTRECLLMPEKLQTAQCKVKITTPQSCQSYFENPKVNKTPDGGNGGSSALGIIGYSLPYRNTACKLTQSHINTISQSLPGWYPNCAAKSKLTRDWETVQKYALEYNWNPAFLLTLWIEETAAGGCGAQQMGCIFRFDPQTGQAIRLPKDSPICEQLACVIEKRYTNPNDFLTFMQRYSGEDNASVFINNPQFPNNIKLVYSAIADIAGFGPSCRIRTP